MWRLYGLLRPYRRTVALGMGLLVLGVAAELFPPLVWIRVVDQGLPSGDWGFIAGQLALLVAVFGAGQLLTALRGLLLERAGARFTLDLRGEVFERLMAQSPEYFDQERSGDLIARVTGDVEALQELLVRGTDAVLASALRLVGVVAIFIWLQPLLGLLVTLPMLGVGALLWRYGRAVRPAYRAARERLGAVSAFVADRLQGVREVQDLGRASAEAAGLRELGERLYRAQVRAVTLRNRAFPLARFVANFGNVIMLGGGVYFILAGQFTLGGLLAYRGYGRYFYGPVDDLVGVSDLLQRADAAGRRVFAVLDAPVAVQEHPGARELVAVRGDLAFEGVTFGYDPARPVLQDFSLRVPAGQRLAVLGLSGAGKSTVLGLLTRQHDPQAGRVTLDGHDLRALRLAGLRRSLGVMRQDTFLFYGTVLENLRLAAPDADEAAVWAALAQAQAADFVRELSQGLHTVVGERGVRLSGGQRQRLSAARLLLRLPPVLLLDEPTSAVDAHSEAGLVHALGALMQGRTAVVVTHRLSLAQGADRVVVMAEGRVVEDGPPGELARAGGPYAALLRAAQAGGGELTPPAAAAPA